MSKFDFKHELDIAWCPGCGNFPLRQAILKALEELNLDQTQVVFSSGIGQAAKMPQYIDASYFNGLHGRGLSVAQAIQSVNPKLVVIAEGGDGDMYGEGGNHFLHNVRRNPNLAHIVHNNMIYGLTKGQGSPTSPRGLKTTTQVNGVYNEPLNPVALALALGASFVGRAFTGDVEKTKEVIKAAILHEGYAIVDIFHPCVTYNKVNTFAWYKNNSYWLAQGEHNAQDFNAAMGLALNQDKFALGILYQTSEKTPFHKAHPFYVNDATPLVDRPKRDIKKVNELLK
jgi:2-oxoglutarate/2-oxoacid ferredoxin oxidoreductase subunit beta